jgi:hypothetical protein
MTVLMKRAGLIPMAAVRIDPRIAQCSSSNPETLVKIYGVLFREYKLTFGQQYVFLLELTVQ